MSNQAHESHTGPIKTPGQLLWTSFFSFVIPIFVIIGLVYTVTKADKPSAGADNSELAVAIRIQRVGTVAQRRGGLCRTVRRLPCHRRGGCAQVW